jgi:hypothetical protein
MQCALPTHANRKMALRRFVAHDSGKAVKCRSPNGASAFRVLTMCLLSQILRLLNIHKYLKSLAHPTEFESVTSAFGGQRSIQLSYGCMLAKL